MKELTRSLALNRIEILRKTNLQSGNEEIKVKTSISVVIKSTTKDSAEIHSFAFRSVHLMFMFYVYVFFALRSLLAYSTEVIIF